MVTAQYEDRMIIASLRGRTEDYKLLTIPTVAYELTAEKPRLRTYVLDVPCDLRTLADVVLDQTAAAAAKLSISDGQILCTVDTSELSPTVIHGMDDAFAWNDLGEVRQADGSS